jgi:hypothetical protein
MAVILDSSDPAHDLTVPPGQEKLYGVVIVKGMFTRGKQVALSYEKLRNVAGIIFVKIMGKVDELPQLFP